MNPVIKRLYDECDAFPLISNIRYLNDALAVPGITAVILGETLSIMNVKRIVSAVHSAHKVAFIDVDLLSGLNGDSYSIKYLVEEIKADAIISRNRHVINITQELNTWSVLKTFLQDNMSLETAVNNINACHPYSLDLNPGVAVPFALKKIKSVTGAKIGISGFFDDSPESVKKILASGIDVVHTRNRSLWRGVIL